MNKKGKRVCNIEAQGRVCLILIRTLERLKVGTTSQTSCALFTLPSQGFKSWALLKKLNILETKRRVRSSTPCEGEKRKTKEYGEGSRVEKKR